MPKVFLVGNNSACIAMEPVYCKNEDKELQQLLENNLDLIPGEQINPEEPRRWLKIKREMSVEDPNTGGARWSIDFLLVDQSGLLTFVECKRFHDTRSRREVLGQMLDYTANGQFYWTSDVIRENLEKTAQASHVDLNEMILSFQPESGESVEAFLDLIDNNLQEGQVRLVFFMEEAPLELKSIVDFLNKQMERTEVLIVEAKQFKKDEIKIVVPYLFGYTEQARRVKKSVTIKTTKSKRVWDYDEFIADASNKVDEGTLEALKKVFQLFSNEKYGYKWGTGAETGSFNLVLPKIHKTNALLTVGSDGKLYFPFGSLKNTQLDEQFKERLFKLAVDHLGFDFNDDMKKRYPSVKPELWSKKVDTLINKLDEMLQNFI